MLDGPAGTILGALLAAALMAVVYAVLRARGHLAPAGPAAPVVDTRESQRRAIEINDDIVQGLTVASYALELGDTARAKAAVDRALASSRSIISEMLGEQDTATRLGPGDLVRREAALRDVPAPAVPRDGVTQESPTR